MPPHAAPPATECSDATQAACQELRPLTPVAAATTRARRSPSYERTLSAVELATVVGLQFFVVWQGMWLLSLPGFMPVARIGFSAELIYLAYVSPVWLHRDPLPDRGLGSWRTLFIRTDNLHAAAWGFGRLMLAGTAGILVLAAIWQPGLTAQGGWQALALRARFYFISVVVQSLILVGFGLPRLTSLLVPAGWSGARDDSIATSHRLRVSLAAAILFGALHAPHPPLVTLASAFGFSLTWISLRAPNVFAAACCQFVLGLQVNLVLGLSMRVGVFHSHPDVRFLRDIFSWADHAIGTIR